MTAKPIRFRNWCWLDGAPSPIKRPLKSITLKSDLNESPQRRYKNCLLGCVFFNFDSNENMIKSYEKPYFKRLFFYSRSFLSGKKRLLSPSIKVYFHRFFSLQTWWSYLPSVDRLFLLQNKFQKFQKSQIFQILNSTNQISSDFPNNLPS